MRSGLQLVGNRDSRVAVTLKLSVYCRPVLWSLIRSMTWSCGTVSLVAAALTGMETSTAAATETTAPSTPSVCPAMRKKIVLQKPPQPRGGKHAEKGQTLGYKGTRSASNTDVKKTPDSARSSAATLRTSCAK